MYGSLVVPRWNGFRRLRLVPWYLKKSSFFIQPHIGCLFYCRQSLLVFLAPAMTRKKLSIAFHLLLQQYEYESWLQHGLQTAYLRTKLLHVTWSFLFLLPSPFVTNLSPYKRRGVGVPNWLQQTFSYSMSLLHCTIMRLAALLLSVLCLQYSSTLCLWL